MLKVVGRLVVMALVAAFTAGTAHAQKSLVLPRAGQVGLGVQGQFGMLMKSGTLGNEFESGPGLTVRLRYRMRYERALGLSFESQTFDARGPGAPEGAFTADTLGTNRDRLTLVTSGVELYQLFDTRSPTVKMLSAGIGLAQLHSNLSDGEVQYPIDGDGFYVSAGAGVERFFYRSWAFDVSTRYMAVFQGGKVNHDMQASVGLMFYASY